MTSTSSSKSEPVADHEEEAKKWERKQFPSQTRYIVFLVVAIVVVMSVAMGIIWAVVQPKRPSVVVQYGYLLNQTISHDNKSVSGNFHFEINIRNPNKKATIYFDTLTATAAVRFSDKTEDLASGKFGAAGSLDKSFNLSAGYTIPIYYSFAVDFCSIYGYILKYQKLGRIIVDIKFDAKIRFGFAKWKSQPRTIHFYCSDLMLFYGKSFKPTAYEIDY